MSRTAPALTIFACEMRGISFASALVIFARVSPHAEKGEVWHGFAHGLDARFDGRGVISEHVQSGPKGNNFDLNLFTDAVVMLNPRCSRY